MAFRIGTIAADVAHYGRLPAVAPVATPAQPSRAASQPAKAAASHKAEAVLTALAPAAMDALIHVQAQLAGRDDKGHGREDRGERAHEAIEDVLARLRDRWAQRPKPPKPPKPPVTPPPVVVEPPVTPPPVTPPPVTPPPVVVQPPPVVVQPPPPAPAPAPVVDSPYPAQRLRAVLEEIRRPVVSPGTTEPFSQRQAPAALPALTVSREHAITLRSLGRAYQGQAALAVMTAAGADATAFQRSLWA